LVDPGEEARLTAINASANAFPNLEQAAPPTGPSREAEMYAS